MTPCISGEQIIGEGKFITLRRLAYTDTNGIPRSWESADRRDGAARTGKASAVFIVARIVPDDELLLIRQFRPPAGRLMIEFPAGLIDRGESAETAAHRELYEETGYEGKLLFCENNCFSSPGMTGESLALAAIEIDGDKWRDSPPQPHPEENEYIEIFRVKSCELEKFIREQEAAGCGIDSKILTFISMKKIGF